ncbi:MAG: pectin methylesterase, partial [Bacilli bacterium]
GKHIKEEGFHHWEDGRESTCRFHEADCRYVDGAEYKRVGYIKELSAEEIAEYTAENLFG